MTIKDLEENYTNRFKFDLTTYDPSTFEPFYKFRDTVTNKRYEVEGADINLIKDLIENIIIETRNNRIEDLGIC